MTTVTYETDLLPPPQLVLPDLSEVMSSISNPEQNDLFLDMPYVPVPKSIENVGSFQLNNLATAKDIKTLQDKVNKNFEKQYQQSTVAGLTLRNGVQDTYDAVVGLWGDLYNNNHQSVSLTKLFTSGNRLRGLGLLFILISLSVMIFVSFT
jgi:hypothetical protein